MPVDAESDLIVQEANVDGTGSQPWIISCYGRMVFARRLDGSGITRELTITGLTVVEANEQARSMWGYNDGSVYCAYVLDSNPYERIVIQVLLDTVNIIAGTVEFFEAAPAQGFALSKQCGGWSELPQHSKSLSRIGRHHHNDHHPPVRSSCIQLLTVSRPSAGDQRQ